METTAIGQNATAQSKSALQLLHDARAKQVAQEFESVFTSMMLKSMRGTVETGDNDFLPTSLGQKIYSSMLDDEYAKLMTNHSSMGIADMVLKQLQKDDRSNVSPLAMLTALKMEPWLLDNKFVPSRPTSSATSDAMSTVSQWDPYIEQASAAYNVDPRLIAAVIAQESGGNTNAVSPKGAKGLMQLMDTTATEMGVKNVYNPAENIMAGTKYLRQMLDLFNGDETLALASYNAGPSAVNQYKGIPPFPETQQYVSSVLALRDTLPGTAPAPNKEVTNENSRQ